MNRYILTAICSLLLFFSSKSQSNYKKSIDEYRSNYYRTFATQEEGPIDEEDLVHIDFYPVNEMYRCQCEAILTPDSKPFNLLTYSNKEKPYKKYANLSCDVNGKTIKISAYLSLLHANHPVYKNRLFIPFMDYTSGESSYGGGRYMDLNIADIVDNSVIVDFNKAYNPWCAYSEGYNCPIPPRENHLEMPINAGEKNYKGEIKVK